jgi:hypothetical protein
MNRIAVVVGLGLLLGACAMATGVPQEPGVPLTLQPAGAGPYDQADQYEDAAGFPLPGWEYVKNPTSR